MAVHTKTGSAAMEMPGNDEDIHGGGFGFLKKKVLCLLLGPGSTHMEVRIGNHKDYPD